MNDIHAIKAPIETPLMTPELWHIILIALFLFIFSILGFVLLFILKRRNKNKKKQEIEKYEYKKSIDEYKKEARQKIILAKKNIEIGEYKIFHLEVTEALKGYLGKISNLNYLDMTTREILESSEVSDQLKNKLKMFLEISDKAKFAHKEREEEAALKVFDYALEIIG